MWRGRSRRCSKVGSIPQQDWGVRQYNPSAAAQASWQRRSPFRQRLPMSNVEPYKREKVCFFWALGRKIEGEGKIYQLEEKGERKKKNWGKGRKEASWYKLTSSHSTRKFICRVSCFSDIEVRLLLIVSFTWRFFLEKLFYQLYSKFPKLSERREFKRNVW